MMDAAVPPRFDPAPLRESGFAAWKQRASLALLTHPATMAFLRRWWPVPRLGQYRFITRYDDVREAFSRPDVFQVPWAPKMQELAPSRLPFVLATDDPAEHCRGQRPIMRALRYGDAPRVAAIAARAAERIVGGAEGTLDAVEDLIARVAVEIYRDYYGLDVRDDQFPLWLMAISNYTFRKVGPDPVAQEVARAATARVAQVVDEAIERARAGRGGDTVAVRLVAAHAADPENFPEDALRSVFTGIVSGYVPVAAMSGANVLEVLLACPRAMAAARQAARDDDDERLARCLVEAARFRPIYPGPWRVCAEDYTVGAGTARARRVRKGETVLLFIQAAMRDEAQVRYPGRFDPDRPASDSSMVLGAGMHWCVGAPIAVAQMTQAFKPLLVRGFRRAPGARGRVRRFGAIPEHLLLALDPR